MEKIDSFSKEFRFLSNFYPCKITWGGFIFPSSENAYQASKVDPSNYKIYFPKFLNIKSYEAKQLGHTVPMRTDWEKVKVFFMLSIVRMKFMENPELKELLLMTEDLYLEEGNTWGDDYWGTVHGKGQNNLGKILMKVREELKN